MENEVAELEAVRSIRATALNTLNRLPGMAEAFAPWRASLSLSAPTLAAELMRR